jgi:integrase
MRREELDFTAHGFRSSFRDWCAEQTNYPREVCEHALAHQLPDKVEAAYLRTDYLEKRKLLMEDWGRFLVGSGI